MLVLHPRSKLFGVSPSLVRGGRKSRRSCSICRRRAPASFGEASLSTMCLLYKEEDNTEEEKGKPVDFYDEIIARNDALVDIMLEKIRRRESNSDSNYNGDSLHRENR